jgi:hypothetical protein
MGRCPSCHVEMHEKLVYLSLHATEFGVRCAGPGQVVKVTLPWCPGCEDEPEETGCLHRPMFPGTESLPTEPLRCDFCLATDVLLTCDVRASYYISADVGDGRTLVDEGIWGACSECGLLIQEEKWEELMDRGVLGTLAMHAEIPNNARVRSALKERSRMVMRAVFGERFK